MNAKETHDLPVRLDSLRRRFEQSGFDAHGNTAAVTRRRGSGDAARTRQRHAGRFRDGARRGDTASVRNARRFRYAWRSWRRSRATA